MESGEFMLHKLFKEFKRKEDIGHAIKINKVNL